MMRKQDMGDTAPSRQVLESRVTGLPCRAFHAFTGGLLDIDPTAMARQTEAGSQTMHVSLPTVGSRLESVMNMEAMQFDAGQPPRRDGCVYGQHGGIRATT